MQRSPRSSHGRRALSYLLCKDSGQPPLQQLQEARCQTNSTFFPSGRWQFLFYAKNIFNSHVSSSLVSPDVYYNHPFFWRSGFNRNFFTRAKPIRKTEFNDEHSERAVTTALWCNFFVSSLKFGVWLSTASHVMLAEVVHSVVDFADQAVLAYWISSSRRAPYSLDHYDYSLARFVWPSTSVAVFFGCGSGAIISFGFHNLWTTLPPSNIQYAALVIGGSFIIKGTSLVVAIKAVKNGAAAQGMKLRDYIWRGHDPTSVSVMTEDVAAVTGLIVAGASLVAVNFTENAIYDAIGSIVVGSLLGMVPIFIIQRNRQASMGRAMDDKDMEKVLQFLKNDPVVDSIHDYKSEVIRPGVYRFKAEIVFNRVVVIQNYLNRARYKEWSRQIDEAAKDKDETVLHTIMSNYANGVVTAVLIEVDRLKKEIQEKAPGIQLVHIKICNPAGPDP